MGRLNLTGLSGPYVKLEFSTKSLKLPLWKLSSDAGARTLPHAPVFIAEGFRGLRGIL